MPAISRSSAIVVVVALGVVIGVGVAARVLLEVDGGATAGAKASGSNAHGAVVPIDGPGGDGGRSPAPADRSAKRVELSTAANASSNFASLDFKPGPADGVPIRVVDARNHQPIAGARVAVVAVAVLPEFARAVWFESIARAIDGETRGVLADAHGIARIEWPVGPAWILGESADLRGERELERVEGGDFELVLVRRRQVEVEVVNAQGVPVVGARVAWEKRDGERFVQLGPSPVAVDARGVAQLERFEWNEKGGGILGVAVLWAGRREVAPALFVPFVGTKSEAVAADEVTPERLRCVVPGEFGAIAVRVVDAFGRLVDEKADLTFFVVNPVAANDDDSVFFGNSRLLRTDSATITGGSDTFAPVPLGLDFRLQVGLPQGRWASAGLRGPRRHGETVRADLAVQSARCRIHGRLVGATKPTAVVACLAPILRRPWLAAKDPEERRLQSDPPITLPISDGGAFQFDAEVDVFWHREKLALLGIDGASGDPFEAVAELPDEITSSDVDLGDVRVDFVAVVAAGRVLSWSRKPLAGVAVQLIDWSEKVRTDASGRFLFVGAVTGERVVIHVDPPAGQADATLAVEAGRRDLDIVLEREGEIAGTFVADHDVSLFAKPHGDGPATQEVSPGVWSVGGHGTHSRSRENLAPIKGGGPFTFLLPPGRYDVLASLSSFTPDATLVARVDDVEVVAGQTTRDPRLDPLVLRGEIGKWFFTLARSDGAPPPSTWVRIASADRDDEFRQTIYLGDDGAACDSTLATAWIDLARPGFRHLHELHERGDVKLVLEPVDSHPFVVHVTVPRTTHDGEITWRVRAEPSWTPPVDDLDWFSAPLGADGTAHLDLDEGEHWRIHVVAVKEATDRARRCEVRRLARRLRDDEVERGTLELRLEPEDVETATLELALHH